MGLTPDQIYDMSLWEYNAYARGYAKRRKNDFADCVYTGYYSGVFSAFSKKKPKVSQIIKNLFAADSNRPKPDVDVDAFRRRERAFNERAAKQNASKF